MCLKLKCFGYSCKKAWRGEGREKEKARVVFVFVFVFFLGGGGGKCGGGQERNILRQVRNLNVH